MSAQDIIFSVGIEGSFELLTPFANAVRPGARYVVREVRTMSSIIASRENPRDLYDQYEVPEADYVRDLQVDMVILGLQATTGEWVYVPQSYVGSYPQVSGVSYRPLAIVAPLGSIPDDQNLESLLQYVNTAVMRELGIETSAVISAVGAAELVPPEEHTRITNARKARVTSTETAAAVTVRQERELNALREENALLKAELKRLI